MNSELKATVVNMKSFSQDIEDPIVVGGGDVNGRTLRVIFTQEAAAQFSKKAKIYLSWRHKELDIKGYNIFKEIKNEEDEDWPPTWEIHYPPAMLHEGNVLACIQLVDGISIASSTNFIIHILGEPDTGEDFLALDDYSDFKRMIIEISSLKEEMREQIDAQEEEFNGMREEFAGMQEEFEYVKTDVKEALDKANQAIETADTMSEVAQQAKDLALDANETAHAAYDTVITSLTWIELDEE